MSPWTAERERRAIVQHIARCSFCAALLTYSRRRSDRLLLDAADQLATEHALADAEREAFARRDERRSEAGRVTLLCSAGSDPAIG